MLYVYLPSLYTLTLRLLCNSGGLENLFGNAKEYTAQVPSGASGKASFRSLK